MAERDVALLRPMLLNSTLWTLDDYARELDLDVHDEATRARFKEFRPALHHIARYRTAELRKLIRPC
jgi:hypothetical protein